MSVTLASIRVRFSIAPWIFLFIALVPVLSAGPLHRERPQPNFAYGQDVSEEDIFSTESFDKEIKKSVAQEEKTKLEKQVGGDLLFSNDFTIPLDFGSYWMSSQLSGKMFGKLTYPDIVTLYVSFNFLHDVLRSGSTGDGQPRTTSLFDVEAELSEFFIDFNLYKKVFFRTGNQLIAWGPSVFWTPVDFINLNRYDPLARLDLRVGKPGLRIHAPFKKSNLFTFFDFSESVDDSGEARDLYESLRVGVRYDRVLLGYELGFSTYFGQGIRSQLGFDFSGVLLRSDFYGEIAVSNVYAFSLGMQKSFGEFKYWQVSGELFYNSDGYGEDPPIDFLIKEERFNPLYTGKLYGTLSLSKSTLFNNANITGSLSFLTNVSDLSYNAYSTLGFQFPKFIPFNIRVTYAGGRPGKTFTPEGSDSISTSVYTKVSF